MIYLFDGSYAGFLTCVFESFERKHFDTKLIVKEHYVSTMFDEPRWIETDIEKSKRVQNGLQLKAGKLIENECYRVFLSDDVNSINCLMRIVQRIFKEGTHFMNKFGDADVLTFHQTLKKVNRERHRMQAFIRFQKSNDGLYFAVIEPDFNVLPLLLHFFRNRYTDQSWLIYDVKRNYGMLYNQDDIQEVVLSEEQTDGLTTQSTIQMEDGEEYYQTLWKQYFKSTNIVERKNLKLHLRHVPRRYWKYLTEKQE